MKPKTSIKLSAASKMPCFSWSLEALDTCPAAKKRNGKLVDACSGCYAVGGNYRFPNVKAVRVHNKQDWQRDAFESEMIELLASEKYFRWFDSGDMYSLELAKKIYRIMKSTPHCQHWLPTRMYKFAKFKPVLQAINRLPNAVARYSSDSIDGGTIRAKNSSTIFSSAEQLPERATVCEAYTRSGKCAACRACWNKSVPVIAYPAHGAAMHKVIRIKELTT